MEYSFGKDFSKKSLEERKAIARNARHFLNSGPLKNPYGVLTEEAFAEKLNNMDKFEMQKLCIEAVIPPTGQRSFLKRKLTTAFAKFVSKNKLKIEELLRDEQND